MNRGVVPLFFAVFLVFQLSSCAQSAKDKPILTAADQTNLYLKRLKGKKVAIVANQTSVIRKKMHGRSSLLHCTCDLKATFTAKGNNPKDFWTGVELCYQTCTKRSIFRKQQGITNFNNLNLTGTMQMR